MSVIYLTLEEVLGLHAISINRFGGADGVRDLGLVESSVARPQQSFSGAELYASLWLKAAALAHSISENQPFVDGNKRTAALAMLVFLDLNGFELCVNELEVYKTIMAMANKKLSKEKLAAWLEQNCKPLFLK